MPGQGETMQNGSSGAADGGDQYINEDASEQYDRQIRLWGVEAQQRMSGSRVLFSGINGGPAPFGGCGHPPSPGGR
ncbi:unnamed protein product [Ectocarpus sp. 12 AP-2014]